MDKLQKLEEQQAELKRKIREEKRKKKAAEKRALQQRELAALQHAKTEAISDKGGNRWSLYEYVMLCYEQSLKKSSTAQKPATTNNNKQA